MTIKDEAYIINLCDELLNRKAQRQFKFDFLVGDKGKNGSQRKLPVDAYYQELNLVIEYKESQHSESVAHFDKPNKITVSGVHRGMQRAIYDQRRRDVLPANEIKLIEISYLDFDHNSAKRLKRNVEADKKVLMKLLRNVTQNSR